MDYLPMFARLEGRPVLLVGGGEVALRKARLLLAAGARLTLVSPELEHDFHEFAGRFTHVAARFDPAHLAGQILVVAATDDHEVNALVYQSANELGLFVNVVDDPERSSFIFPQLQSSNCLRIPSMLYSILAPMELTKSRKRSICILFASSHAFFMHCDCIVSNSFESDTSNRTCFCSEIRIEQTLRKSDALKNLCSTIATDSTDTHLCHNLEQTLLHSFDIISFSCVVVFLNLSVLYELIKYSVSHIRTQSRNSITK